MVKNASDPFALSSACMCVGALINKIYFDHDVTKTIDIIASFFGRFYCDDDDDVVVVDAAAAAF